jgi:hypothetical protein
MAPPQRRDFPPWFRRASGGRCQDGGVSVEVITYAELADRLVAAVPAFRTSLEEHLVDHDGEVLNHLLFGDLSRFTMAAHERGDRSTTRQVMTFVEEAFRRGDDDVRNVISVSFVENFIDTEAERQFVSTWPASLQREAEALRRWWFSEPPPAGSRRPRWFRRMRRDG